MTISTELRKAGPFTGNGVTTAFPFSFKVFAATDVAVTVANTQGNESALALGADYAVALNADQDAAPGGTVTLAAPLASGHRLVVSSAVPNLQPTDITNNGGFYPRVIEDALDRHVAQVQQIDEKVGRALKVAITSPLGDQALPSPVAGMLIGWNESSDGLKNYAPIGGTLLGQQLAAANGSSLVGFQQSGTGAVATTVQAKLRETVSVKDFGAVGDGVTDDTTAIQNAVNAASEVRFTPGKTYIVSPQTLSSLGGGVGICINVSSNRRLVIYGATIKQKDGTGGSGAVIGNTAAVQNVLIEGGTVDGNRANTSNTMGGIVFYNATNCEIRKVLVKGSRQIGAGFRSTTTGFGKNAVRDCIIEDSGYIGIQCNRQDLGVEISGNIVDFSVDNAIDVEGNNTSGDPGFGSRIVITNNRCSNFTTGIFLESIGNAIVSNNYLDNFNVHGIILNRINSGALNVIVANNQITNGAGRSGVLVNNNSGNVIIDGNFFKTLAHSIECNGAALGLSVGKNLHVDISQTLIKVPQGTNQLIHSRIGSQDYRDARVVGKPFTISPLSNTNNFPARAFNTVCAPTCYMEDGVIASTVEDEYKDGITGTLDLNGNWGAYSIYSSFYNPTGETLVTETASSLVVGRYVTINGTLFKVSAARTGTEFALQSAAGVDGDYTATTNGAYAWVEYYPEWQTT